MSERAAPGRAELITTLDSEVRVYETYAEWEEISYWVGSGLAAICSALAGLSISATTKIEPGTWLMGLSGPALLAIVPAVWVAIERSINLRRLAIFNATVASQLKALSIELKYNSELTTAAAALRYSEILKAENAAFGGLFYSGESSSTAETLKKAAEAEATKKAAEAEATKKAAEAEATKKAAEAEATKKAAEAEATKKAAEGHP